MFRKEGRGWARKEEDPGMGEERVNEDIARRIEKAMAKGTGQCEEMEAEDNRPSKQRR